MKTILALFLLLPAVAFGAEPTVLVNTMQPQQGSLPITVTAYGTTASASNTVATLNAEHEARVSQLLVTDGEHVAKGQALLTLAIAPAAQSAYQQALSALALARKEKAHTDQLFAQQLVTRDQVAQADKAVIDAQSTVTALQRTGHQQAVEIVAAPFDGIVTDLPVALGAQLAQGTPLLSLANDHGMVLTVGVEPAAAPAIKTGAAAAISGLTDTAVPTAGKVLRIDQRLNPKTHLIDTDLAPADNLLLGQAYRAVVITGEAQGWLVPRDVVLQDDQGAYLFQVENDKAVRVAVKILVQADDRLVVDGPLDPQRALVISGAYQLSDGAVVRTGDAPAAADTDMAG